MILWEKTSNNFEQKLIDALILEKKITLLADESTDVCIVWDMKFQNTIQDHYLGIINVEKTESHYLTETTKPLNHFFKPRV